MKVKSKKKYNWLSDVNIKFIHKKTYNRARDKAKILKELKEYEQYE